VSKNLEKHFANKELKFFNEIKSFFKPDDRVLKIGNGFGYLSTYIANYVREIRIFELQVFPDTINKEAVEIYDGQNLPVEDKYFDVCVFNLVLHHIPNNEEYLKQVMRTTKRSIVLYEQTYDNLLQKINLVWRDWYINKRAGTPCRIYWRSYFKRSEIQKKMEQLGLKVVHRTTKRSHKYYKELLILEVPENQ